MEAHSGKRDPTQVDGKLSAIDRSLRSRGGERETQADESSVFLEDSDSRETVVRTLLRHVAGQLAIEGGVEAALNRLDSRARLTENDAAVLIPNAAGRVEEQRGEAFAAVTFVPAARLDAADLGGRAARGEHAFLSTAAELADALGDRCHVRLGRARVSLR